MATDGVFRPNTEGLTQLYSAMLFASQQALDAAWKVLRIWGQEYKRRVQRVVPVEFGTLRQSWQIKNERTPNSMQVVLGTNLKSASGVSYPLLLEIGTDRIAGGDVKRWVAGMPPVMEWPAKMADIPNFFDSKSAGKAGSAKFERSVGIATKAFTSGTGEQMPFIRPVGYELAPKVVDSMRVAIQHGLDQALGGQSF